MVAGGLLAEDAQDKNFDKFNKFLNSNQTYLSYSTNNKWIKETFTIGDASFALFTAIYLFTLILSIIYLLTDDIDILTKKSIKLLIAVVSIIYIIYLVLCIQEGKISTRLSDLERQKSYCASDIRFVGVKTFSL